MAYALGIDIGTTTVSACVLDEESGRVVRTWTKNHFYKDCSEPWKKEQDAVEIIDIVRSVLDEIKDARMALSCIGLTGQMHGILYLDKSGNAVSPLITWQDGRGDLKVPGTDQSYADTLERLTGFSCATGYGCVTHYYDVCNNLVPESAHYICTIMDYLFLVLCGEKVPVIHPSDAASIGLFDIGSSRFDIGAIEKAGMDASFFPDVQKAASGKTPEGIPVAIAIGDNQASVFGALKDPGKGILVNVGTGSQVSLIADSQEAAKLALQEEGGEIRPFIGSDFLLVGSVLCGGKSYAMLESFFRQMSAVLGGRSGEMYALMNDLAKDGMSIDNPLEISTTFCGTRKNPALRGKIENIDLNNFTPAALASGLLGGCARELYSLYTSLAKSESGAGEQYIVGSGNGIRKNPAYRKILEKTFGMPLKIPAHKEEAAYGAALFSMMNCLGKRADDVRALIHYTE